METELTLYGNTPVTSPYVLSAFVALEEKGLSFRVELLDLERGDQFGPGFVEHSITNRVPTLRHGDFWLSESLAIVEYLEERFPPPEYPALWPTDTRERARARMVSGLIRSDFLPIREERSTETFLQGKPVAPLSEAAERSKERLLRIARELVGDGRPTLVGSFTVADADLALMLLRLVANDDPVPAVLCRYARRIARRPSLAKWLAHTSYRDVEGDQ